MELDEGRVELEGLGVCILVGEFARESDEIVEFRLAMSGSSLSSSSSLYIIFSRVFSLSALNE